MCWLWQKTNPCFKTFNLWYRIPRYICNTFLNVIPRCLSPTKILFNLVVQLAWCQFIHICFDVYTELLLRVASQVLVLFGVHKRAFFVVQYWGRCFSEVIAKWNYDGCCFSIVMACFYDCIKWHFHSCVWFIACLIIDHVDRQRRREMWHKLLYPIDLDCFLPEWGVVNIYTNTAFTLLLEKTISWVILIYAC